MFADASGLLPFALVVRVRIRYLILALVTLCSVAVRAAQNATAPEFDVVSIKRNTASNPLSFVINVTSSQASFTNVPIRTLLYRAFDITADTAIVGVPSWADSDRYDIIAKSSASPSVNVRAQMFRTLLVQRLKLVAHMEMRDQSVLNLVLAREDGSLGPGLSRSTITCREPPKLTSDFLFLLRQTPALLAGVPRTSDNGQKTVLTPAVVSERLQACSRFSDGNTLISGSMTMGALAEYLTAPLERLVIDRTGLQGSYAVRMIAPSNENGGSLSTALRENLGLKLDSVRAPAPVLVIDHIERPSEN